LYAVLKPTARLRFDLKTVITAVVFFYIASSKDTLITRDVGGNAAVLDYPVGEKVCDSIRLEDVTLVEAKNLR
jgi:hypothetical protein